MLIHPYHALSGVILDTDQDKDKSNFLFLLEAGIYDQTSNDSALYFSGFIPVHDIDFLK